MHDVIRVTWIVLHKSYHPNANEKKLFAFSAWNIGSSGILFFCCLNRKSCNVHFCCCPNHGIVISTCNNYEMRIEWSICPFFIFSLNWFDGLQFCNCSVSAKPYITSHCNHLSFMVVRMHLFQFKTIRFVTFSALLFGRSLTTPYRGGCYSCLVHVVTL